MVRADQVTSNSRVSDEFRCQKMQIRVVSRVGRGQMLRFARKPPSLMPSSASRDGRGLLLACSLLIVLLIGVVNPTQTTNTQEAAAQQTTDSLTGSKTPPSSSPAPTKPQMDNNNNKTSALKTTSETSESTTSTSATNTMTERAGTGPAAAAAPAVVKPNRKLGSSNSPQVGGNKKCDYDKGQWGKCDSNGSQQRIMRLKLGDRTHCKSTKTMRRDCRNGEIGCKYARGEWSSVCRDGKRVRVDSLVGLVDADGNERTLARQHNGKQQQQQPTGLTEAELAARCKPHRRVTKDCARTCHYVKSAWSKCSQDGFRTRVLTLKETTSKFDEQDQKQDSIWMERAAESSARVQSDLLDDGQKEPSKQFSIGDNQICARQKLIRRECRLGAKLAAGQQQQQQQQQQLTTQPMGPNMKQIQRRRLKQMQLKQQQQQAATSTSRSSTQTGSSTTTPTSSRPSRPSSSFASSSTLSSDGQTNAPSAADRPS